jgi:Ner family transcriptional regulator
MREPNAKGERAIAAALGTMPHLLWRSRYRPSGQRRSPQNWTRVPTLVQRRNERAA